MREDVPNVLVMVTSSDSDEDSLDSNGHRGRHEHVSKHYTGLLEPLYTWLYIVAGRSLLRAI